MIRPNLYLYSNLIASLLLNIDLLFTIEINTIYFLHITLRKMLRMLAYLKLHLLG